MFQCLKLKYNGHEFVDEEGNTYAFFLRGYITTSLEKDQWYYCQIKNDTLYEFVKVKT